MNRKLAHIIVYGLPLPVMLASLFIGPTGHITLPDFLSLFYKKLTATSFLATEAEQYQSMANIIFNIRLPRVLLTFLIGAALSTSGSVLQALFRNPLVDSYVLGISSGAAFGAAFAINYAILPVGIAAFIGGALAVLCTFWVAGSKQQASIVSIVLSGMIVSGLFTAFLAIVQYISNPYKLQVIVQWTMGNLHTASWTEVQQTWLPVLIPLVLVFLLRWRLNLLSLGDDAAKAVGVNPMPDKLILIGCATLMTATTVAAAGIISFYGLFLPHIVRMLLGADNVKTIPGNIFLGGVFLLIIDNLARALFVFEIPVGIITIILGGSFFVYLMRKQKLNWN